MCGADSIRVALTGLGDCWGEGWGGGCGGEEDGRTDPRAPSVFGLGRPLVVAARSKACRRAAPWPLPPSPFCAFVPVIPSSSNAHDLFLGFTSAKAELKLTSLEEPFAIKAAQL